MNRTGLLTGVFLTCCVLGFLAPRSPRHHVEVEANEGERQVAPLSYEDIQALALAKREEEHRRAEREAEIAETNRREGVEALAAQLAEAEAKAEAEAEAEAEAKAEPVSTSASTRSSKKPKKRWTQRHRNLAALGTLGLGALATGALAHSLKPSYKVPLYKAAPGDAVRLYGYENTTIPGTFGPELNPMGITPWKEYEEYPKGYNHGQGGIKPTVPVGTNRVSPPPTGIAYTHGHTTVPVKLAVDNFDYATYFATPDPGYGYNHGQFMIKHEADVWGKGPEVGSKIPDQADNKLSWTVTPDHGYIPANPQKQTPGFWTY